MPVVLLVVALFVVLTFVGAWAASALLSALSVIGGVGLAIALVAAYVTRSGALGALAALLGVLTACSFALGGVDLLHLPAHAPLLPALALLGGVLVFSLAGLHFLVPPLASAARAARLTALAAALVALLMLGTRALAGYGVGVGALGTSPELLARVGGLAALSAVAALLNHRLSGRVSRLTPLEGPVVGALLALVLAYLWLPLPGAVFLIGFNAVALLALLAAMAVAVTRPDRRLLDVAGAGLGALLLARLFELGWPRLSARGFTTAALVLVASVLVLHLALRARTPAAQAA